MTITITHVSVYLSITTSPCLATMPYLNPEEKYI